LKHSSIISCGLGEDASFDVEFAAKYESTVIILDPTPRAIRHFEEIMIRMGSSPKMAHTDDGKQPVESYDLTSLKETNLRLCRKALWNERKKVRFFSPPNESHISHSIVNFQDQYRTDAKHIEVDAVTIDELISDFGLKSVELIKMDIEGAEIEVIQDMLHKNILSSQILVEYDELLAAPSRRSKTRIECCHEALLAKGYRPIHIDPPSNFLYTNLGPVDIHRSQIMAPTRNSMAANDTAVFS